MIMYYNYVDHLGIISLSKVYIIENELRYTRISFEYMKYIKSEYSARTIWPSCVKFSEFEFKII